MAKRGAIVGMLLAALMMAAAPALAGDRGHRGDGRHWDRGHHRGEHWDRGRHRGGDWNRGHHRGHDKGWRNPHQRPIIIVPRGNYYYYGRPHRHRHYDRHRGGGGIYLRFDLSSLFQAPVGAPVPWQENDRRGTLVTTAEYGATDGRYCREYQKTVTIGGRLEEVWGTACQQPNGDWQIVDERG